MSETSLITIEKRRLSALISALQLARYAMLQPGSRIICPPHTSYVSVVRVFGTLERVI